MMSTPLAIEPCDQHAARQTTPVVHNWHGIAALRLLDAAPGDVRRLERALGVLPTNTDARLPEITIRFVERLELPTSACYLGTRDTAFTANRFYVLQAEHKTPACAEIPFRDLGGACEIIAQRGKPIPQLVPILNLTALQCGWLPLHASALLWNGQGVVVCGWPSGGKTATLLAMMSAGAQFLGDDFIYVAPDGQQILGGTQPVEVKDIYLRQLPVFRTRVAAREQARLWVLRVLLGAGERIPATLARRSIGPRTQHRLRTMVENRRAISLAPEILFGQENCHVQGSFDKLLFVLNHDAEAISVERVTPDQQIERVALMMEQEFAPLTAHYRKFRSAFPECRNALLETLSERLREQLRQVVQDRDHFEVRYSKNVPLARLYDALQKHCF